MTGQDWDFCPRLRIRTRVEDGACLHTPKQPACQGCTCLKDDLHPNPFKTGEHSHVVLADELLEGTGKVTPPLRSSFLSQGSGRSLDQTHRVSLVAPEFPPTKRAESNDRKKK